MNSGAYDWQPRDFIAVIALIVSLSSVFISLYTAKRDRSRVRGKATPFHAHDNKLVGLTVQAVNHGRRDVLLLGLGAVYSSGATTLDYIGDDEGWAGLRLTEGKYWQDLVQPGDSYTLSPDGEIAIDLFFQDTLGRKYRVRQAKKYLGLIAGAD